MINFTNTQFEQTLINRFNENGYIGNNRDEAKMIMLTEAKIACDKEGFICGGTLVHCAKPSACLLGDVLQELVKSGDLLKHPILTGVYKLNNLH